MSEAEEWNLRSRISRLLRKDSCSGDVEFVVGTPPERHLCHKVILAAGSEVFHAMFYGPLAQRGPVVVPDVTSRGFVLMLQYLYSDNVSLRDQSDAFETAYSARKYMVPSLLDACESFLLDRLALGPEDVLDVHEDASLLGMERLREHCLRYVSRNARKVFSSGSHYSGASRDALEAVLSLDHMDIESEREIVEALWLWGVQRCAEEGVRMSDRNVRRHTEPFLKHVRFLAMDFDELAGALEECRLLDAPDELALLWNLALPGGNKREPKVPSGICTKSQKRSTDSSFRVQIPGRYLYDGNMTSFLVQECRTRADITVAGDSAVTVIGAVIAFEPVPCYSREHRHLEVELQVSNCDTGFRSGATSRIEASCDREVQRPLLLDDYVVIEKGHAGSLTVAATGEGVRLLRLAEDAAVGRVHQSELRLEFDRGGKTPHQFVPIKELMVISESKTKLR